jgi:hypothetical protein
MTSHLTEESEVLTQQLRTESVMLSSFSEVPWFKETSLGLEPSSDSPTSILQTPLKTPQALRSAELSLRLSFLTASYVPSHMCHTMVLEGALNDINTYLPGHSKLGEH